MSTVSQYMGFPISTIGTDSGLTWETNILAALSIIDQHNHSPGQGQQINPSGLNINSDLPFNANNATLLRAARFTPQVSPIPNTASDVGEIYVSGNELYYNDVTGGNQVQITSSGTVNATSSGISSGTATAAFSTGVLLVKSSSTSFANVAIQSLLLSNAGNLSNQLTLQAPALSGSYSLTLPSLPGSQSFLVLDASGNISATIPVANGITRSNLAAVGQQVSSSSGVFSTTSTSFVQVTNLSVTITSGGRPIMLIVQGIEGTQSDFAVSGGSQSFEIAFFRGATQLGTSGVGGVSGVSVAANLTYLDLPSSGTYTYTVKVKFATSGTTTAFVQNVVLVAYEL